MSHEWGEPLSLLIILVQGVGMAMRELLHTVDGVRQRLPQPSHHEVRTSQSLVMDWSSILCSLLPVDGHGSEGAEC